MRLHNLLAVCMLLLAATTVRVHADGLSAADFTVKAYAVGKFEVQASRAALKLSSDDMVKAFAKTLIEDQNRLLEGLVSVATSEQIKIKGVMDDAQRTVIERLNNVPQLEFDQTYFKELSAAHEAFIALFSSYARSGTRPALKKFAADALPSIAEQLNQVKQLAAAP